MVLCRGHWICCNLKELHLKARFVAAFTALLLAAMTAPVLADEGNGHHKKKHPEPPPVCTPTNPCNLPEPSSIAMVFTMLCIGGATFALNRRRQKVASTT